MPIVVAALGALVAVYFFVLRARNAAQMTSELVDVARDVRSAARRFGFTRRANLHPVEAIDDPDVAIAVVASAFTELDGLPTEECRRRLAGALEDELGLGRNAAEELLILARWLTGECQGADPAIARAARKLMKIGGAEKLTPLLRVLTRAAGDGLTDRQREALEDIKRAFHIR